jgi:diguanylate cyclase (GGDEF)-like protein
LAASYRGGILAQAFASKTTVVADDISSIEKWPACFPETGSELCAPLISLNEPLGAIIVAHEQPLFFTSDDRAIAQAAADVSATAARNVQLTQELRRVANSDILTGAYNQRYFHTVVEQELARGQRYNKQFGLVLLDLCGFRSVNDALGLDEGDELLRKVARALQSQIRSNDTLSRYAGDRFALVVPECEEHGVQRIATKLQGCLKRIEFPSRTKLPPLSAVSATVHYPTDGVSEAELTAKLFGRLEAAKQKASGARA